MHHLAYSNITIISLSFCPFDVFKFSTQVGKSRCLAYLLMYTRLQHGLQMAAGTLTMMMLLLCYSCRCCYSHQSDLASLHF